MSRLLIIGASILQLPAIKKAKELGHYVAVADFNPQAVGVKFADEFFNASTIDEEAICNVSQIFKPDGIMTLATDMPMRSIAKATTLLGLTGITYDTAIKATDKGEMIKAFKEHNVESPWFYITNQKEELNKFNITYPCILKPTDNAGSRGVIRVDRIEELYTAFSYSRSHSREGYVIIEEFLEGTEVSVEVIVLDGISHILAITDKLTTGAPYFVEMGHSQPSQLPEDIQNKIKDLTCRAIKAIGIQNGPAHVEMMITLQGPKMIELGARMGGDCITTHLVPLSTGVDMIKATIDIALGNKPNIEIEFNKGSAIRYFNTHEGEIKSIEGVAEALLIEGVQEIIFTKKIGDKSTKIKSSNDRIGFIITQNIDAQIAVEICNNVFDKVKLYTNYI